MFKNKYELKVYCIFFSKWLTLKEASRIYNPNMPETARNDKTVQTYFTALKKRGWLDFREEIRFYEKRKSNYPTTVYKANYNFFFTKKINESKLKDFLKYFLHWATVRSYLNDNYKEDIPSGVEEIIKQLFVVAVSLKQSSASPKIDKNYKDFFDVSEITLRNYEKKIKEKINKFYLDIMVTKSKKIGAKKIRMLDTKTSFWMFLNLFALVMIKLFFNKDFANQIVRASPELYHWLWNLHGDFSFVS